MSRAPGGIARLNAVVRGRVQGVGYRWFVQDQARVLGLSGRVGNLRDGTVEVDAEGPRSDLEALLERLREGPSGADVSDVEVAWWEPSGAWTNFEIRATR
ncbi:MAG: acylphosphatase [Candidatus Coatesbacteria bacterium]